MGIVCPLSLNLCHEGDSQEENGGGAPSRTKAVRRQGGSGPGQSACGLDPGVLALTFPTSRWLDLGRAATPHVPADPHLLPDTSAWAAGSASAQPQGPEGSEAQSLAAHPAARGLA